MVKPDPNFSPLARKRAKFRATVSTWYTNDGTRVICEETFSGETISNLGYSRMHHWHRHVLQPLIIPPDEYRGFGYSQGKWDILYAPIVPVFTGNKFYGYYYFWNCNIQRYDLSMQMKLERDEAYRKEHEATPRKWWSYDPESITYQNTYGKGA